MKTYKNEIKINASAKDVWDALIDPDKVEMYMFGSRPESSWAEGEEVKFYIYPENDKTLAVKGRVSEVKMQEILEYSLFPVQMEIEDIPDNYIRVRFEIETEEEGSLLKITQDGFDKAALGEQRLQDAKQGWKQILPKLKEVAEQSHTKT